MPHFDKHFTLAEAKQWIPRVQAIFTEIRLLVEKIKGVHAPSPADGSMTPGRTNGDQKKGPANRDQSLSRINQLITEITDNGIVIQDVNRGLIDFPAYINGEEVFLCYELADGDEILYFHELNAGYAGRQPLPDGLE